MHSSGREISHFSPCLGAQPIPSLWSYSAKCGARSPSAATAVWHLLLAGVELYAVLGREFELLEIMRSFAHDMHQAVEGTPTALELEKLFDRDPPS